MAENPASDREARCAELGYPLASSPATFGLYIPAVRHGALVMTSGAVAVRDGTVVVAGKVGADVTLEQAQEAARICTANALTAIRAEIGSLHRVVRVLKLTGFVNSAAGFTDQPTVLNAASQMLIDVFGEAGRGTRSAVGVAELPLNSAVELELMVEVQD